MTEDDLQAPAIRFERVRLDRGTRTILRDVSFSVPRGSVTAVIGPSGGGKSTLLYAITGELAPAAGVVQVLGETLPRPNARELFALRRRMGVMLQGNGLLTDLSVFENVALPVRTHTPMPEAALHELIIAKLAAVGLGEAGDLMPQQLSGGMARRVALARALVLGPPLMLYDEPLTGLDPIACGVILHLIRQLNDRLGMTSVVITHHVRETLPFCDRVLVVANHGIAFDGTAEDVLRADDPLVHQFLHGEPDGPIPFDYRRSGSAHDARRAHG
ncbi:MAG: ATP-binding cassette domain-containing protein [Chiayiivirga sp.]|jgi:phospholipid/cholesterol/gamma-HCH transport system ATP-binding protein|uniref:ABC transporter ATP-binding protein n=1 Tax=Chiayiivirga sp. TaxID=2041042 RepID=UPI0025C6026C|nr:ATP-binding cassette domain-containing protein [Chiayiivirga sp.]MCI1711209.1 ATP-binding cassette domain-containing protein [Chiayiivirga sp.]MCI1727989.1 ATP-binding cassette domain-containing protein [Chiayiivirga sp.]